MSHRLYTVVQLKPSSCAFLFLRSGRRLAVHGQHGNRHPVPHAEALRLVLAGQAKLLPGWSLGRLREQVAAEAAEAA
jgi:hypothetical protein